MDHGQRLVDKTESSDTDKHFYFILFPSQNAFLLFMPNVVLMLPVFATLRSRAFACSNS